MQIPNWQIELLPQSWRILIQQLRKSIKIALGLFCDLQRRPKDHDRFRRKIRKEMRRVAGFGEDAFEVDEANGFERFFGAEGIEIEMLDRLDGVAEEIDADGEADLIARFFVLAGEIDIDNSAAHGKIAWDFDLIESVVAVLGEPDDELFGFEGLAGAN